MALTKRVEVLFDPEHYRVIEQLARSQGKTVGALVRKAAVQGLLSEHSDLSWEEAKRILETDVGRRFEAP